MGKNQNLHSFLKTLPFTGSLLDLSSFVRTRREIHQGEALWDFSHNEIKQNGLMGPWKLNVYESMIAGLLSFIIIQVLGIVKPDFFYAPWWMGGWANDPIEKKASLFYSSLAIPFTFLVLSYAAGEGSLRECDSNKENRRRARRVYLYLDGAYGLLPQTIASTTVVLLAFAPNQVYVKILGLIAVLWNSYISFYVVPNKLFVANNYQISSAKQSLDKWLNIMKTKAPSKVIQSSSRDIRSSPPRGEYMVKYMIGGGLLCILIYTFLFIMAIVTADLIERLVRILKTIFI